MTKALLLLKILGAPSCKMLNNNKNKLLFYTKTCTHFLFKMDPVSFVQNRKAKIRIIMILTMIMMKLFSLANFAIQQRNKIFKFHRCDKGEFKKNCVHSHQRCDLAMFEYLCNITKDTKKKQNHMRL